jgi:uncharacterized protein YecT (DUF1311 family)
MIIVRDGLKAIFCGILIGLAGACDSGSPSKTPDEFAADSALAADLALANRDTLLVDSIGEYHPSDTVVNTPPEDSSVSSVSFAGTSAGQSTATIPGAQTVAPPTAGPSSTEAAAPAVVPAATPPANTAAAPSAPAPKLTGAKACTSATAENQSECLRVQLAAVDARMNRIYRALITEMRLEEKVSPSAKDPASVQRLRVAQRAWLVHRDNECRRRGKGKEGALWARPRARCLGQFSTRRANELADIFSRLTAH